MGASQSSEIGRPDLDSPAARVIERRSDPDAALVRRAVDGDVSAFEALVLRHGPSLSRLVTGLVADPHTAEDVVQEIWILVYRRLHTFRFEASFRTWLARVAVREAVAARVRLKAWWHRLSSAEADATASRWGRAEAGGEASDLLRQLERLPVAERSALVLIAEGFSYAEAAEALACPIGTISVRVHRARERLAARLGETGATGGDR